jgi:hypothetical protein
VKTEKHLHVKAKAPLKKQYASKAEGALAAAAVIGVVGWAWNNIERRRLNATLKKLQRELDETRQKLAVVEAREPSKRRTRQIKALTNTVNELEQKRAELLKKKAS